MKRGVIAVGAVTLVLLGGLSSFLAYRQGSKAQPVPSATQRAEQYPLLARRVFSDKPNDPLINFGPLRDQLNSYYASQNLKGSLYFEYLPTGVAVHVRGDEKKAAASLLKVPLGMEIYKAIELGKLKADQKITIQQSQLDSGFGSLYKKGAGHTMTIEEAVKIMLTESDNTAVKVLSETLGNSLPQTESVFNYLDTAIQQEQDFSVLIGARAYSSILKCLHYACYLTPEDSQRLLDYLTQTPFNDRLAAGVLDKTAKIAHKIGVFQETTQSDCGIVYLKSRPYILCIMLDGQDNQATSKHIADLSRQVYTFVSNQ